MTTLELTLTESNYSHRFKNRFPLKASNIGLLSYFTFYSFPNISEKYENNLVRIANSVEESIIKFDDGIYEVDDISDKLPDYINISVNKITLKLNIKITNEDVRINFGKMSELLGLDEDKWYTYKDKMSMNLINIQRNLDKIYIHCDLIENHYVDQKYQTLLYSIILDNLPGAALKSNILNPAFYPIKTNNEIYEFTITLRDANQRLIEIREPIHLTIIFK